jgi:dTDP-4-dehydrorhamnose reductase
VSINSSGLLKIYNIANREPFSKYSFKRLVSSITGCPNKTPDSISDKNHKPVAIAPQNENTNIPKFQRLHADFICR